VILGCAASIVEPAPTRQTKIDSPAGETNQPVQHGLSGLTDDVVTPALRTHMLSPFLSCCSHGVASLPLRRCHLKTPQLSAAKTAGGMRP
jgi:hypothetical protein